MCNSTLLTGFELNCTVEMFYFVLGSGSTQNFVLVRLLTLPYFPCIEEA